MCGDRAVWLGGVIETPQSIWEVQAAGQMPGISDLSITDTGNGISASCSYIFYDLGSDYLIRLYLDEWTDEGTGEIRANKILEKSDAGSGFGMTDPLEVNSGIYYAMAVIRESGGAGTTVQFHETRKYRITKTDGGYQIIPWQEGSEDTVTTGEIERAEKAESVTDREEGIADREGEFAANVCEHSFEVVLIRQPDADHDAVAARQCRICGDVAEYMEIPNSAYAFFQRESADKILEMPEGEVVIHTDRWISFHRMVTDAIMQRPKVQVTVRYRYRGKEETVVIPAGSDRTELADTDGYCGFLYLKQRFGV